jgi:NTE family protein
MSAGKTAFVLAGGGSLGSIQVGMLRALLAAGVFPDFVVGSSVGALNASYFAAYPHAEGVEALAAIWLGLRRRDVFPFSAMTALAVLRGQGFLVDPAPLRRLVESTLPFQRLEEAPLPVHLVATDMQGVAVRLSDGSVTEAIMASAAVPGVFPPVEIGGVSLMDGAIAANTPLSLAAALGARRVIILPTGYACDLQGPPTGAVARALHAVTLLIAWQLMRDIERLPREIELRMAPALCPSTSRHMISRRRRASSRAPRA